MSSAGEAKLLGDLPDVELQFTEFDEAQPVPSRKTPPVEATAGEVMQGTATWRTAASVIRQPVEYLPLQRRQNC